MKEEIFWNWFVKNREMLEHFLSTAFEDLAPYERLTEKIREYHPALVAELSSTSDQTFILVISCDGLRSGIDAVMRLFETAPIIEKWQVQPFRQPGTLTDLNFKGLGFKAEDIRAKYFINRQEIDIELYIPGFREGDPRYLAITFLYLDHLIGEYLVMTKVGNIALKKKPLFMKTSNTKSLPELAELIRTLV